MDSPYFSQWPAQDNSSIINNTLDTALPNIPYLSSASASPVSNSTDQRDQLRPRLSPRSIDSSRCIQTSGGIIAGF